MEEEEFTLVKIHTDENGSDMLTKNLPMERLEWLTPPHRSEGEYVPPMGEVDMSMTEVGNQIVTSRTL